ncbi:MAG: hypothetical protein Tsb0013_15050 [Phycisphaerales bacterium]
MTHRAPIRVTPVVPTPRRRSRRGFTLAEAAMASVVLGLIMLAVATAIGTAQQMAFESQKRLLASIAADDLLSEVSTLHYDDLPALNGRRSAIGAMRTLDNELYPDAFWPLGRRVAVVSETVTDPGSGASIDGLMVTVACHDAFADLATYQLFVPDPNPDPAPEGGGLPSGKDVADVPIGGMGFGGRP